MAEAPGHGGSRLLPRVEAELLRLRYRLLWAQVRLRRGKIAVFLLVYLLVCFGIALVALGGVGAAMASIRLGKAELVARIVLTGFSAIAVIGAVALGIGVNPAFSEAVLRRYPLSPAERFLTRRLTAFLDPLWLILLALFLGIAAGFRLAGAGSLWLGMPAALLLAVAAYLSAQLLTAFIEWITATPAGLLICAAALALVALGMTAAPAIGANRHLSAAALLILSLTPPFDAAAAMAAGSIGGLLLLLLWCAALAAAVAGVEHLPAPSRTVASAEAEWDSPADRLAGHFGSMAPLVSKTLKYYWRTNRTRISFLINIPAFVAWLIFHPPDRHVPLLHFFLGLGIIAVIGFSATWVMAVNAFGFDGPGFRRYFLLPLSPAQVMRAASVVPLLLGAALVPFAFVACVLFARVPVDARMAAMLASNGVGGLFFFQALAVWTSLMAPSRADGSVTFHNDYSWPANLGGNLGMLGAIFGSMGIGMGVGRSALRFWWIAPAFAVFAAVLYVVTLRLAPAVLVSRREAFLSVLEREQEKTGRLIT